MSPKIIAPFPVFLTALLVFAGLSVAIGAPPNVNSDVTCRQIREAIPSESFVVEDHRLERDLGVLVLRRGTVSFAPPVEGRVTLGVFVGEGEFTLIPPTGQAKDYSRGILGKEAVTDAIRSAVFVFTDDTYREIASGRTPRPADPEAAGELKRVREKLRHSTETPRSMGESLMGSGDVENLDAEVLASVYNLQRPAFFAAFLRGREFSDLRFLVRPWGAVPGMMAPEEVALVNVDPGGDKDGILYLGHRREEAAAGGDLSAEDKRMFQAESYRIETTIGGDRRIAATCTIGIRAVAEGERVVRFDLLPSLRVSKVTVEGAEIPFIQEDRKDYGAFYAILPRAAAKGATQTLTIVYEGDKVITDAGGGNYYVGARTSWYPNINSFRDRAKFELRFRYPRTLTLVSVGRQVKQARDGDSMVAEWASEIPLAVAGFNYGRFKVKDVRDASLGFEFQGYATGETPDYLRSPEMSLPRGINVASHADESEDAIAPSALLNVALAQAQNAQGVYPRLYGSTPYGRLSITQQPDFNYGQSWPTLVYLPMSAFLDGTQRWKLMGSISYGLTAFVNEVTAHEVAHQWWGHMVGWQTFHDQWLSEGPAVFSAGLYLQATEPRSDKYVRYWADARERILLKNEFGRRANDAGPLWLGQLAETSKNRAYQDLIYQKGGYVFHMLHSMMFDPKTGDQAFIALMQDFFKTHLHQCVTTAQFQKIVEKHMTPVMDVARNGKVDWFFKQWVYGTDVPRYRLDYTVTPQGDKWQLAASITQSEVGEEFAMPVPLYVDFDGQVTRLGRITLVGNSTVDGIKVTLPKKPRRVMINAFFDVLEQK